MTSPAELQESVDAFYRELHRTSMTTSRLAEVARLKVLIARYPDQARQMVADLDLEGDERPAGEPDPAATDEPACAEPDGTETGAVVEQPTATPPGEEGAREARPVRA